MHTTALLISTKLKSLSCPHLRLCVVAKRSPFCVRALFPEVSPLLLCSLLFLHFVWLVCFLVLSTRTHTALFAFAAVVVVLPLFPIFASDRTQDLR